MAKKKAEVNPEDCPFYRESIPTKAQKNREQIVSWLIGAVVVLAIVGIVFWLGFEHGRYYPK